ncbi:MAG: DEAD/DEAH box helicase family protein [Leptothrix sp. (in: b-proteobacteria)]
MARPSSLIINKPDERPGQHWVAQPDKSVELVQGRRPASYDIYDVRNNTRRVEVLDLVNDIRGRVDRWRDEGYQGVTEVTRMLLEHWHDRTDGVRQLPFYFCQLEAIETLIWWVESLPVYRQGVHLEGDGGSWERLCNKMATGSGKTTVMAMIITWQVLNAVKYVKRTRDFSSAVFIVAPGITVKNRLQVLLPGHPDNMYDLFSLCPSASMRQQLNQAEVLIENWHSLMPLKEADRSVVRKGKESDAAYARRVLGRLAERKNLVVINDEAHHAYRKPADVKISKAEAEERGLNLEEATRWIEGLDRIHATRGIQRCFDLSATPFAPTGKANSEEGLYSWIVSDFGLNDAIEAGLVKTPRVVLRDDALPSAKTYKSKLYHLYREDEIAEDLNRKGAEPHETLPLLLQHAYTLLGADWRHVRAQWAANGAGSPPVMLTVCNRVETAARIEHFLNRGDAHWPELQAPERTLRVDSKVLEKAELGEKAGSEGLFKTRLGMFMKALSLPESVATAVATLKKDAERLALLAGHLKVPEPQRAAFAALPIDAHLDGLVKVAPIDGAVRDYLLGATEYVNRLREIVRAAGLKADKEAQLLSLDKEDLLRAIVDTVGRPGHAGQGLQSVISVAMLSEGWDAKNVTHIMGLRAFTSQLLCEQVIGRGLRRVTYDKDENGLLRTEYVNVFGVPLSIFLDPGEGDDSEGATPVPKVSVEIEAVSARSEFEITWPNVLRVDILIRPKLTVEWSKLKVLSLDPAQTMISADLAPVLNGAPVADKVVSVDLERLPVDFREQRLVFQAARKAFDKLQGKYPGNREYLLIQLIRLVEQFLASPMIKIANEHHAKGLRRQIMVAMNIDAIVGHVVNALQHDSVASIEPVFDTDQPIGSTQNMRTWFTTKNHVDAKKSQINRVVGDSTWEVYAAQVFDASPMVAAFAKNDHLGFQIHYLWNGSKRRFLPDFLVRLTNGKTLVLEIKGEDSPQNVAKREALAQWTDAINSKGGFGAWCWDVAFQPSHVHDILARHGEDVAVETPQVATD